jgi:WD40 repeat protein
VLVGHGAPVTALAFAPDGKTLASGGVDRNVRLWHVATAQEMAWFGPHAGTVLAVAFAPDGRTLVSGDDTGQVRLWKAAWLGR